jgi:hypothetical protein
MDGEARGEEVPHTIHESRANVVVVLDAVPFTPRNEAPSLRIDAYPAAECLVRQGSLRQGDGFHDPGSRGGETLEVHLEIGVRVRAGSPHESDEQFSCGIGSQRGSARADRFAMNGDRAADGRTIFAQKSKNGPRERVRGRSVGVEEPTSRRQMMNLGAADLPFLSQGKLRAHCRIELEKAADLLNGVETPGISIVEEGAPALVDGDRGGGLVALRGRVHLNNGRQRGLARKNGRNEKYR